MASSTVVLGPLAVMLRPREVPVIRFLPGWNQEVLPSNTPSMKAEAYPSFTRRVSICQFPVPTLSSGVDKIVVPLAFILARGGEVSFARNSKPRELFESYSNPNQLLLSAGSAGFLAQIV